MCRRSLRRFLVHMTVVSFTCVTDLFYTWHTALYICDTGLFLHVLQVFTWVSFTCDIGLFYMRYTSLLHMPYSCLVYDIGLFLKVPQIFICVSFTYDIGLLSARPNQLFMFPYWCVYHSVHIQYLVPRILRSRIRSSAQDYAVLVLFLNIVESLISTWLKWSGGNLFYQACTSSERADRRG